LCASTKTVSTAARVRSRWGTLSRVSGDGRRSASQPRRAPPAHPFLRPVCR
jgi:hypothetical protein